MRTQNEIYPVGQEFDSRSSAELLVVFEPETATWSGYTRLSPEGFDRVIGGHDVEDSAPKHVIGITIRPHKSGTAA